MSKAQRLFRTSGTLHEAPGVTYKRGRYFQGVRIHDRDKCSALTSSDNFCPFDWPSDHKMRGWPMLLRTDSFSLGLIERLCPHGVGHPDPDSVRFMGKPDSSEWAWSTHGCDGCCR